MADAFDVGSAATEALRARGKPGVLIGATLAYALVTLAIFVSYVALNWNALRDVGAWYFSFYSEAMHGAMSGGRPHLPSFTPPAEWLALAPTAFAYGLLGWIVRASYEAACLRWLVRGEKGGFFGLTLGGDTWLIFFTYLVWIFVALVLVIACACVIGATFAALHAAGGVAPGWAIVILAILAPIACLAAIAGMIYIVVRLAPAAASSIAAKRFAFFAAWSYSRGRFWPLLGAFLVAIAIYIVASMVVRGVFLSPLSVGVMREALSGSPSIEHLVRGLSDPQTMAMLGTGAFLYILIGVLFALVTYGINARAVTAPREDTPAAA